MRASVKSMISQGLISIIILALLTGIISLGLTSTNQTELAQKAHQSLGGKQAVSSWNHAYALLTAMKYEPTALGQMNIDVTDIQFLIRQYPADSVEDVWVRGTCLSLLGEIGSDQAIETLANALQDPNQNVRTVAAISLSRLGDARAATPLLAILPTLDSSATSVSAASEIASALMSIDDRNARQAFIQGLQSENKSVRVVSALWLGQTEDQTAVQTLLDALKCEQTSPSFGPEAFQATTAAQVSANTDLMKLSPVEAEVTALSQIADPDSIKPLVDLANSNGNLAGRQGAIMTLSYIGNDPIADPLIKLLQNPNQKIRGTAALALGNLHPSGVKDALNAALGDKEPTVKINAASSLLNLGYKPTSVMPTFANWAGDASLPDELRISAVNILGSAGEKSAVEPLINLLDEPIQSAAMEQTPLDPAARQAAGLSTGSNSTKSAVSFASSPLQLATVRALGRLGDERAFDILNNSALQSSNQSLSIASLGALGQMPDSRAIPALQAFLQNSQHSYAQNTQAIASLKMLDPLLTERILIDKLSASGDITFKQAAIPALADSDDPLATQYLLKSLDDNFSQIRYAAIDALSRKTNQPEVMKAFVGLLETDRDLAIRSHAALALEAIDFPEAQSALRGALNDPYPQVRSAAIAALTPLADADTIKEIRPLLNDPSITVRQASIITLGSHALDFPETATLLSAGLTDPNRRIRQSTIMGLSANAAELPQLQQPLLNIFNDPSQPIEFRQNALLGLSKMNLPKTKSLLLNSLNDSDWRIRQSAAVGVGSFKGPEIASSLKPLTQDNYWPVRQAAAASLTSLGDSLAIETIRPLLKDSSWQVRQTAVTALNGFDNDLATQALSGALQDTQPEVRYTALGALTKSIKDPTIRQAFVSLVNNDLEPAIRSRAALGLYNVDDLEVKTALGVALRDPSSQVRSAAVLSLTPMVDLTSAQAIKPLLSDSSPIVRQSVILSLGTTAKDFPENIELIKPMLQNDNWAIRQTAIEGLGSSIAQFPELKQPLSTVFTNQTQPVSLRQNALLSLSKLEQPEIRSLLVSNLSNPDWRMRQTAILGLGNFKTTDTLSAIKPLATDNQWQVRQAFATSLANFDSPTSGEMLRPLLSDRNWQVRQTAVASFGGLNDALKTQALTPLLSDRNLNVRQTASEILKTNTTIKPISTSMWIDSSQHMVNSITNSLRRECDDEVYATYTDRLMLRDAGRVGSYTVGIAGVVGGPLGVGTVIGVLSLANDTLIDFGPKRMQAGLEVSGTILTGASVLNDSYGIYSAAREARNLKVPLLIRPGFIDSVTSLSLTGSGMIFRGVGDMAVRQPVSAFRFQSFASNDGFTHISGTSSVYTMFTPTTISRPFFSTGLDEGTRTYSSQSSWSTRVGPSLNTGINSNFNFNTGTNPLSTGPKIQQYTPPSIQQFTPPSIQQYTPPSIQNPPSIPQYQGPKNVPQIPSSPQIKPPSINPVPDIKSVPMRPPY